MLAEFDSDAKDLFGTKGVMREAALARIKETAEQIKKEKRKRRKGGKDETEGAEDVKAAYAEIDRQLEAKQKEELE